MRVLDYMLMGHSSVQSHHEPRYYLAESLTIADQWQSRLQRCGLKRRVCGLTAPHTVAEYPSKQDYALSASYAFWGLVSLPTGTPT